MRCRHHRAESNRRQDSADAPPNSPAIGTVLAVVRCGQKPDMARWFFSVPTKMKFQDLPVIHFNTEFLEGDYQLGTDEDLPMPVFRRFYEMRNAVLRTCHRFGTVGPAGDYQWNDEEAGVYLAQSEIVGDDDPDFFIVDDIWNSIEYIHVEPARSNLINLDLLSSLVEVARSYPGWATGIYLDDGCVLIFADKLMVKGSRFKNSSTSASVAEACSA